MKISARRPTTASQLLSISFTKIQAGFCLGGLIGVMAISFGLGVAVADREKESDLNGRLSTNSARIQPIRSAHSNLQNIKHPVSVEFSDSKETSSNGINNAVTIRPNFYKILLREKTTEDIVPLRLAGNRPSTPLEQTSIPGNSHLEERTDRNLREITSPSVSDREPSKPGESASAKYTVQVTSVQEPAKAIRIIRKLRESGFSGFIHRVELPGKGAWLRIRVGRFIDLQSANQALKALNSELSSREARVVPL